MLKSHFKLFPLNNILFKSQLKNKFIFFSFRYFSETDSPTNKKFNLLFFGNDEISLPSLEKLYENSTKSDTLINKLTVITTPNDNKKSTQGIFHKYLQTKNLEKIFFDKKDLQNSWRDLEKKIVSEKYNLGLIASFGQMIPMDILKSLDENVFVMHPSLLPKYRGGAPIQHTLLNNEKKTGITICQASIGKFDAGDIVLQKSIDVEIFHRFKELSYILSNLGAEGIMEFLSNYENLLSKKVVQKEELSSKAPLIIGQNIYLDFINDDAIKVLTDYKSFFGSQIEPFSKFMLGKDERQIFFDNLFVVTKSSSYYTKILNNIDKKAKPGAIFWDIKQERNFIFIKSKNDWLATNKIKLNGTNYLSGEFFIIKMLQNKRFNEINKNELNYRISPNEAFTLRGIEAKNK